MKLKQLLTAIKYRAEQVPDVDITDLVYDSRKAVPGCAFVCLRGANADGHKYAKMAAEKGAAVIIAEEIVEAPVPVILTDNTRLALAYLSAEFFGHPAEQMHVIGITGTKGAPHLHGISFRLHKRLLRQDLQPAHAPVAAFPFSPLPAKAGFSVSNPPASPTTNH